MQKQIDEERLLQAAFDPLAMDTPVPLRRRETLIGPPEPEPGPEYWVETGTDCRWARADRSARPDFAWVDFGDGIFVSPDVDNARAGAPVSARWHHDARSLAARRMADRVDGIDGDLMQLGLDDTWTYVTE